jgi:hypothetical protein
LDLGAEAGSVTTGVIVPGISTYNPTITADINVTTTASIVFFVRCSSNDGQNGLAIDFTPGGGVVVYNVVNNSYSSIGSLSSASYSGETVPVEMVFNGDTVTVTVNSVSLGSVSGLNSAYPSPGTIGIFNGNGTGARQVSNLSITYPPALTPAANIISRYKIVLNSTALSLYLDGELQVQATDSTFTSGESIAFWGQNAETVNFMLLNMRNSDIVTITGTTSGMNYVLRSPGGLPLQVVTATGTSITFNAVGHYPAGSVEQWDSGFTVSNDMQLPGGAFIYGGDSLEISSGGGSSGGGAPLLMNV